MVWKESAEAYTLPSVKEIASGSSAYDAGTRSRCSVTAWRMGTQGCLWPIHASLWPIHANLWREPSQYCKAIILYLKKKKEKLKKKKRPSCIQVVAETWTSGARGLLGGEQPSGSSGSAASDSVHFASPGGQHRLRAAPHMREDAPSEIYR